MPTRELRLKYKSLGLCVNCGQTPVQGRTLCEKCRIQTNRGIRKYRHSEKGKRAQLRHNMKQNKKRRLLVLQKISGQETPVCLRCGCKDLSVLTINHKNLGGRKELLAKSTYKYYKEILSGQRDISDLEILCDVCNRTHYIEKKTNHKWRIYFLQ